MTAAEILALLRRGSTMKLDNGWELTRSHVAGDEAIELVLASVISNKDEIRNYGFFDETIYHKRRWFVEIDNALDVLTRLLARRRAIRDMTAAEAA